MIETPSERRVLAPTSGLRDRSREVVRYRELLANLVRKELKVKYKNSALGFLWTTLNPLLYLVIFSVVLGVFLRSGIPFFAYYLLTGLLAWNLFQSSLQGTTTSLVYNANLISKVYFPRAILPLAAIGASLVHFALQLSVLLVAMALFAYPRHWDAGLALLPAAVIVELVLIAGLGLALSSLNVFFRDVQHLIEVALLAWFWMTPIVYASAWVQERLVLKLPILWQLYLANPMAPIVLAYQRALYSQRTVGDMRVLIDAPLAWYAERLGYAALASLVVLAIGWRVFKRLEGRLAEEL